MTHLAACLHSSNAGRPLRIRPEHPFAEPLSGKILSHRLSVGMESRTELPRLENQSEPRRDSFIDNEARVEANPLPHLECVFAKAESIDAHRRRVTNVAELTACHTS